MKVLVAITSYGNKNDRYLDRVLSEYRSLPHETDIVVFSNTGKELGNNVEVVAGLPSRNPYSLPFGHKRLFAERRDDYDLFIYSEDDILLTQRNIEAFLRVTAVLPSDRLAGFFRWESYPDGRKYFPDVHAHFRWRGDSVRAIGDFVFAQFTNDHSACYLLTREQLSRAIDSGGFLVGPHEGRHGMLETAATDPYTQCGFNKVLCISHLEDFLVAHLPNKYVGTRLGLDASCFLKQLEALIALSKTGRQPQTLLDPQAKTFHCIWSKDCYEPCRQDLIALLPPAARAVLSIGCGWGATERELVKTGVRVVGIPVDPVISRCAELAGIEIISGGFEEAAAQLAGRQFDAVLISGILHLLAEPEVVLRSTASLLADNGALVASFPNIARLPHRWQRFRHPSRYPKQRNYSQYGMHWISRIGAINLFRNAGLAVRRTAATCMPGKWKSIPAMLEGLFSLEFVVIGSKRAQAKRD